MPNGKVILALDKFFKRISSINPFFYIIFYLLAIPIFAGVYSAIPSGFYAPYAQLEYNGKSDAYQTGILIQTAIRRALHTRSLKSPVFVQKLKFREDIPLYVSGLSVIGNSTITFEVMAMLWNEEKKDNIQIPMQIVMRASSSMEQPATGYDTQLYRVVELDDKIPFTNELQPLINSAFIEIFRPVDDVFTSVPMLELSKYEDRKLSQFFDGISGNAISINGGYGRMCYFSSVVITTVGFGDIVPITAISRSIVAIEAVLGVILAALFLNAVAYRAARRI